MEFTGITFLLYFLPICILGYYIFAFSKPIQNFWLLLMSLVLYSWGEPVFVMIMVGSVLINWLMGLLMHAAGKKVIFKKIILAITCIADAGLLVLMKYTNFIVDTVYDIIEWERLLDVPKIALPIGISVFVLQEISYIVDVYKGKIVTEQKFWRYLLFLSYFPAIVQGPISRYDELAPQLCNTNKFDPTRFQDGLTLVLLGLVKKIVVADRLAIFVNNCFTNYETFHGMVLYVGAVCYAFQLYMDFSGCVDICRGVSGMFGISLVENFKSPYYAKSTKEFWNRWHLSLSRWLKDYVYIPLGGNRHGRMRKYVNLIITFGVSGMWHGAGFNYIVWGVLQAVYQIVGEITSNFRSKFKARIGVKLGSASDIAYSTFITFHLTVLSWVFFRSKGFSASIVYLSNMFSTSIYGLPLARIYLLEVFHWRYLPCLLCMLLFFWELKSVVSLRMWSVKISESFILC